MSLRRRARDLKERRDELGDNIQALVAQLNTLEEKLHSKQKRDPKDEERARKLDRQIRRLHVKLEAKQREAQRLRKKRSKVTRILKKVLRKLRPTGAKAAVKWAVSKNGVTENPSGSNWGHPVQDWIQATGYTSAVPWCGCFASEAESKGHEIPVRIRRGYAGYINDDAANNANGLKAVSKDQAQPGDLFTIGSSHIGVVRGKPSGGYVPTVEGNTSPSSSGSQYNGGCVALKSRSLSSITTVARPSY